MTVFIFLGKSIAQHNRQLYFLPAITQSGCKETKKNAIEQDVMMFFL
jgi:hypothetical protein